MQLFTIMAGLPVTIRLLDPPLHEFLPHTDADMAEVAKAAGKTVADVKAKASQLHEANPMLGHRGCRLGVTYPGNLRDAVPRHLRGGRRREDEGRDGAAGGDDPAGRR